VTTTSEPARFRHLTFPYDDDGRFFSATLAFIRGGLSVDDRVLVMVTAEKIDAIRSELGDDAGTVDFVDVDEVGRNPARILPEWTAFAEDATEEGRGLRGIAEPMTVDRSAAALSECLLHELLVNTAFVTGPAWELLCPIDRGALGPPVVEQHHHVHPFVSSARGVEPNPSYVGDVSPFEWLPDPLPPPAAGAEQVDFDLSTLRALRASVDGFGSRAGLSPERRADLVLAVDELACNSVLHGTAGGVFRGWRENETVMCEVTSEGTFSDPMVGRRRPTIEQHQGRGLWVVNQLCDLVQIRSSDGTSVVRVEMQA
jgi:anti-sigma regulatory factor (Ser/Thr protein kinase)